MTPTTALDLSARRYALAYQVSQNPWFHLPQGPRPVAGGRGMRLRSDGRKLLLALASQSAPAPSLPLRRQTRRMLRRASAMAYRHRKAIVMGTETCAFGTFLATFLSCLWLLG